MGIILTAIMNSRVIIFLDNKGGYRIIALKMTIDIYDDDCGVRKCGLGETQPRRPCSVPYIVGGDARLTSTLLSYIAQL